MATAALSSGQPLYYTTREACRHLGYSRPSSLLRAWRARDLPLYRRPGGRLLVSSADIERFLTRAA